MGLLINWVVSALVILSAAYILPGVHIANFTTALVTALVLGIINAFVKPVLLFLTLPINILTLGLFTFILNAFIILLVSEVVPGFKVDGFFWALAFSVIVSIINYIVHSFI